VTVRHLLAGLTTTFLATAWLGYVVAVGLQQPPVPDAPRADPHDPTTGCAREAGFTDDLRLFACECHPQAHHDGEECVRVTEDNRCQKYCRKDLCLCTISCEHEPVHLLGGD
jgi:hypothetical protein